MAIGGQERREQILRILRQSDRPIAGTELAKQMNVSRQVVVQDMALLRTEGYDIVATARGYMLNVPKHAMRVFKVFHTNEQTEDELTTIVDLGGSVMDVMVNHRVYGRVNAALNIRNRRDVQVFMEQLKTGKSTPLLNLTSGYHFHKVMADREEILDEIEEALRQKGMLTEVFPYEKELAEV